MKLDSGPQLVDGEGRLLPTEDVDFEPSGSLIRITGKPLTPPADPRPGMRLEIEVHSRRSRAS